MTPKILEVHEIGPSLHGSTGLKNFAKCPQLYAYSRFVWGGMRSDTPAALSLGSGVHYALALHSLRVRARQRGDDPEEWMEPVSGLREALRRGILDAMTPEQVQVVGEIYGQRFNPKQVRGPRVIHVEEVLPLDMGETLDLHGHPEHGQVILYDPRIDLVSEGAADGKVNITDYKTAQNPNRATIDGYALDWQFLLLHLIGQSYFRERFGGVYLHLIETKEPYRVDMIPIHAAPFALARAQARYLELYKLRAQYELETLEGRRSPFDWPAAMQETVCVGRYGRCAAYDLCRKGPAAKPLTKAVALEREAVARR